MQGNNFGCTIFYVLSGVFQTVTIAERLVFNVGGFAAIKVQFA